MHCLHFIHTDILGSSCVSITAPWSGLDDWTKRFVDSAVYKLPILRILEKPNAYEFLRSHMLKNSCDFSDVFKNTRFFPSFNLVVLLLNDALHNQRSSEMMDSFTGCLIVKMWVNIVALEARANIISSKVILWAVIETHENVWKICGHIHTKVCHQPHIPDYCFTFI